MFTFAIEKGVVLSVGILIVCLFGAIAIVRVPVQMIPNMDTKLITVRTNWPGATPQDVEKEILIEQESYLRKVPNLAKMTSQATMGTASIQLEYTLGTDIQEAMVRVNNALTQVPGYPENVDQPRILTSSSSQDPFIFYTINNLPSAPANRDVQGMKDFLVDEVATALERVPGVSEAVFYGGASRQVHIDIDPAELAQRQISISQLRQAIRARNRDVSGGDLESGKRRYVIRTIGRFQNIDDISNTIIAERNGIKTLLRDVGEVSLQYEEVRNRAYINGQEMFMMPIKREMGANVVEVLKGVKAEVERLNATILKDQHLSMNWVADDVGYVKNAIFVVQKNLALGAALACLVLLAFFRTPAPTLLGTVGVPICTIGAFLGLLIFERTLNVISLAGIAFAIGMTLDNSIVVLENILRHRAMGKDRIPAALDGVQEVWKAVLAATLTTVFVFAPVLLIEEDAGQLYSDIAIAISCAIIMSMFISITLIPSVCSRLSDRACGNELIRYGILQRTLRQFASGFQNSIMRFNRWLLSSITRRLILITSVMLGALLVILFLTPRAEYLPEGEEPKIFAFMLPPPGYNLSEIERIGAQIDAAIVPYVSDSTVDAGTAHTTDQALPAIRYFIRHSFAGRVFTVSEPLDTSPQSIQALRDGIANLFQQTPGMISFANKGSIFSGNMGGSRSIELNIQSADLNALYQVAMTTFISSKQALDNPQIRPIPGLSLSQPEIAILPDWNRASELGINSGDLGYSIWAMTDGAYLDEYFLGDDKIDIYLYSKQGLIKQPEDIAQLPIYTGHGDVIPLGSIAEVKEVVSADTIRRVDGNRTISLIIVPPVTMPLEEAVEIVERDVIDKLVNAGDVPKSVNIRIGGASDKLKAIRNALDSNLLIAILLSYLLMVGIFSHWGYPLIVLLNLPLGISGGVLGLWLMNQLPGISIPFDIITMLGMIVLTGTVVNNPILLVEQTRRYIASGIDPMQAILQSTQTRLRPIMMSMLTTVFGLSPVVFLPGAGTELYRGLGTIVLFGLFFSTMITLTFTPALLSLVLELRTKYFEKDNKLAR